MFKIEIPKIEDLREIDKIALQVHECHVKWRPDIFIPTNLIVGYISVFYKNSSKNGYRHQKEIIIDALGVKEEYRNQGIGRKLLEFIKEYAIKHGYTNLKLTVNEENENAIHLYEKLGFKVKNISYSMSLNNKK